MLDISVACYILIAGHLEIFKLRKGLPSQSVLQQTLKAQWHNRDHSRKILTESMVMEK